MYTKVAKYLVTSFCLLLFTYFSIPTLAQEDTCAGFLDVPADHELCSAISYVKEHGVFEGYPDGTFHPDAEINRAEVLKVFLNTFYNTMFDPYKNNFQEFLDVKVTDWYFPFVQRAKKYNFISGYIDGRFHPERSINRVEILKMLLKITGEIVPEGIEESPYRDVPVDEMTEWYIGYVQFSKENDLFDIPLSNKFYPDQAVTRGEVAELLYRYCQISQCAFKTEDLDADDHVYGNTDATVLLVEYSDFECPYCQRFHTTVKEVVDNSEGEVVWVYRHFPLTIHFGAQKKAEGSECAAKIGGEEAFWEYTETLFADDANYSVEELGDLAFEIGLDKNEFQDCLDSGEMMSAVQNDLERGYNAGVNGTPGSFVINTKTRKALYVPGAVPIEFVEQAIESVR